MSLYNTCMRGKDIMNIRIQLFCVCSFKKKFNTIYELKNCLDRYLQNAKFTFVKIFKVRFSNLNRYKKFKSNEFFNYTIN